MATPAQLNLAEYFLSARLGEGSGEKVALITDAGSFTYREVDGLASRFGNALLRLGVRQEERVLIALPDTVEFVGALFGALRIGAVAVMLNPELSQDHLEAVVAYSRATAAVVHHQHVGQLERARAGEESPRLLVIGDEAGSHTRFVAEEHSARLVPAAVHRDDPALWLFSGGTTGPPKAVVQTHRSFANTTDLYAKRTLGYRPDDLTLSVPKLYFGYATGSNLFFPFAVGATSILFTAKPTPELVFDLIRHHRPTILINVPAMVNAMVTAPMAADQDLSCLRLATTAGEALPESLYHRWKQTFHVELLDGLGTAEMWHIFVTNRLGDVKPGTLGKVVEGFEVRIRDEEGRDLPAGETGRLWVRGGSRAWGYWQNLERTQAAFRGEWFVGGDLASLDEDGYLTHRGRADDAVKVKGKWLNPQEVESCLLEHPAVKECAVIAVEDEAGLLKPVAFVVPRLPSDHGLEEELQRHVLSRLEPYKHPRKVYLVAGLPQTHLGKVDRSRLRQLAG